METLSLEEQMEILKHENEVLKNINNALKNQNNVSNYEALLKTENLKLINENDSLRKEIGNIRLDMLKLLESKINIVNDFENIQKNLAIQFMRSIRQITSDKDLTDKIQCEINKFIFDIQHCVSLYKD